MVSVRYLLALAISVWHLAGRTVCGNGLDEPDYEVEYNVLKKAYTGYDYTQLGRPRRIGRSTIERLKLQIIKDLKCSYMFSAMHYSLICKRLIERDDLVSSLEQKYLNRFEFVEETKAMLATMKNCGQLKSMDAIWWIYVHSLYVSKCMQLRQTDFLFRNDAFKSNLTAHLANCKENNQFNNHYDDSGPAKDIAFLLSRRFPFEIIKRVITTHKETFAKQMENNKTMVSPTDGMGDIFDVQRLCLNYVYDNSEVMQCLLKDFGELAEWSDIEKHFKNDYYAYTDNKQVEIWLVGLAKLQTRIVCLLKFVMLQIVLRHGYHVHSLRDMTKIKSLKQANKEMIFEMSTFVKFLGLGEDRNLNIMNIEKMLKGLVNGHCQINGFYDEIKLILDVLATELYDCKLSYPKLFDQTYVSGSLNLMASIDKKLVFPTNISKNYLSKAPEIQESLMSARVFNRYIQETFEGINFEVIHSFIQFSHHLQ